jgi:hypothetical protein
MLYWTGTDMADAAVLLGGPMDGQERPIEADLDELVIVTSHGQLHRYDRTAEGVELPGGRGASVFRYSGRIADRRLADHAGRSQRSS